MMKCLHLHARIRSALHSLRVAVKTGDCPTFLKGGEWAEELVQKIHSDLEELGITVAQFGIEQELAEAPRKAALAWYRDHFAYMRGLSVRTKLFEKDRLKSNLVFCLRQEDISISDVAGDHFKELHGWHPVRYDDYPRWANSGH